MLTAVDHVDDLERGRAAYRRRAWLDAFKLLSLADETESLAPDDSELLATAAFLIGRGDDGVRALQRAHNVHRDAGEAVGAARCAMRIGFGLADMGDLAGASGWFGRAQRILDGEERDCVERGHLLVPAMFGLVEAGDWEALDAVSAGVLEIGERFSDVDLVATALLFRGNALIMTRRVAEGLALLDEAMVAVVAGELSSPQITGFVYCGVIDTCSVLYELRRATEWTAALTRWCDAQPDMVNFTGQCLVHRAEIMQLHGAWHDALAEGRRAAERFARSTDKHAGAAAFYRQGEVHRLLGEFAEAEDAFRCASQWGWEPQPGLALLRLEAAGTDRGQRIGSDVPDGLARNMITSSARNPVRSGRKRADPMITEPTRGRTEPPSGTDPPHHLPRGGRHLPVRAKCRFYHQAESRWL